MPRAVKELGLIVQLREAVQASGRSLTQLGKACKVDPGQLSRFMRGERLLSLPAAAKVAEFLQLKLIGQQSGKPKNRS
jgi:hypothetical protein